MYDCLCLTVRYNDRSNLYFFVCGCSQQSAGVSSVSWDISTLNDGNYNIIIQVGCKPSKSLVPSASVTFSSIANVLLDRNAPIEYIQHARPAGPFYPGDDISMVFNEAIVCSELGVSGKVSDGSSIGQGDFLVSCSDNSVFLDFSPSMSIAVRFDLRMRIFCLGFDSVFGSSTR